MSTPNAFVILHFGANPKYLELELYALRNLRDCTTQDIVYLYSVNDTPSAFVDAVRPHCTSAVPYDDAGTTYARTDDLFKSIYPHFNTLRTCNFMFAHGLKQYKRVCLVETDIMFQRNIDDVFALRAPAVLTYFDISRIYENYRIAITVDNINKNINGGLMLFAPSAAKLREMRAKLEAVVEKNSDYPNETLFLLSYKTIYNLPFAYNGTMYQINDIGRRTRTDMRTYLAAVHMNAKIFKQVECIRDGYAESFRDDKPELYHFIKMYKKKYYGPLHRKIEAAVAAAAAKSNVA